MNKKLVQFLGTGRTGTTKVTTVILSSTHLQGEVGRPVVRPEAHRAALL